MTSPSVETPEHDRHDKAALALARFRRFSHQPRNRAGIAIAVVFGIPLLIIQAAKAKHPAVVAADAIPALFVAFLLGRAIRTEPDHARSDEVGMLAYMPLAIASFTFLLIPSLYANVGRQPPHSLDGFYTASCGILAALLIALMIESHRLFHVDPQLQALRSWWISCVVIGLIAALTGLTPAHSGIARETAFQTTWAGLAGAITAGALVMSRDYLTQLAEKTRYTPARPSHDEQAQRSGRFENTSPRADAEVTGLE